MVKDSNATYTPGLYERRSGSTRQLHHNLKSVEAQTTLTPAISASRTYDDFGNILGGTGTHLGPFGYGGGFGYQEDATGLKLLGHRLYDSSTGRFLTRDPIKDGRNWYTYCENDPINYVDPNGLNPWKWFRDKVDAVVDFFTSPGGDATIDMADAAGSQIAPYTGPVLSAAGALNDINEHGFGNYDKFYDLRDAEPLSWMAMRPDTDGMDGSPREGPGFGRPEWRTKKDIYQYVEDM